MSVTDPKTPVTTSDFVADATVERLYDTLRDMGIPVARAARDLGLSRGYLTQMLTGTRPMKRVYALALQQLISIISRARQKRLQAQADAEAQI